MARPAQRVARRRPAALDPGIEPLLALIDQSYEKQAWHGPNLRGSIRGLDLVTVSRRPAPGRHNIWEVVVHCAYWKYAVWRRLTGQKRGSFPLKGSNWFARRWRAESGPGAAMCACLMRCTER